MQLAGVMEEAIDKKRGVANSDPANNVVVAVKQIATIYTQKLNENYAQRGEYLVGDKQLERELTECNNSERFLLLIIEK
jgi:thymidine phosphorylase